MHKKGFSGCSEVKASASNVGDLGWIPGSGRSPGEGNGNPLPYSCLENPMDRGAWQATVHKESDTTEQLHIHKNSEIDYLSSVYKQDNVNFTNHLRLARGSPICM